MHSWGAKQTNIKEMYYLTAIKFAKWEIALNTKTGVYHFVNTKVQSQYQMGTSDTIWNSFHPKRSWAFLTKTRQKQEILVWQSKNENSNRPKIKNSSS